MNSVRILSLSLLLLLAGCGSEASDKPKDQDAHAQNHPASSRVDKQIGQDLSNARDHTIELVASAKTLPADFNERAFKREEVPLYEYFVKKADNPSDYKNVWDLYGFEDKPPRIDFNEKNAIFIGLYESGKGEGNCPKMIKNVKLQPDNQTVTVSLGETGNSNDNCEEMATPRTHVMKVPKDVSQKLSHLTLVEKYDDADIETEVPPEN